MAKNTASVKAIAQAAAKMSATSTASAAEKSPIERFAIALNTYVRDHFDCVEHKEGSSDYFLRKVDLGKGACDYRVKIEKLEAKEGKRAVSKRELYRINPDGSERIVQYGTFKKKYLYNLMMSLVAGKPRKVEKLKIDKDFTRKVAEVIRADRKSFKFENGVLTGKVKDVGAIKLVETVKKLKTGKEQMVRQLFVDGKLTLEGGQLNTIKNAFIHTGATHRTMKEIMADANDAVSDLI